jgi:hypothetical protein
VAALCQAGTPADTHASAGSVVVVVAVVVAAVVVVVVGDAGAVVVDAVVVAACAVGKTFADPIAGPRESTAILSVALPVILLLRRCLNDSFEVQSPTRAEEERSKITKSGGTRRTTRPVYGARPGLNTTTACRSANPVATMNETRMKSCRL